MVHALQLTHKLLRPGGLLINVHDLPVPHLIELTASDAVHKVGWISDREGYAEPIASLAAVTGVVADGLFVLEDERNFIYTIYADNLEELQTFLAEWWKSALLPERTIQQLESFALETTEPTRIAIRLQARMTKLRAA